MIVVEVSKGCIENIWAEKEDEAVIVDQDEEEIFTISVNKQQPDFASRILKALGEKSTGKIKKGNLLR